MIFIYLKNIVEIHIVIKFNLDMLIFYQVTVRNKGGRIFLEQSVIISQSFARCNNGSNNASFKNLMKDVIILAQSIMGN